MRADTLSGAIESEERRRYRGERIGRGLQPPEAGRCAVKMVGGTRFELVTPAV